ncbi:hypothetical protein [Nibrella saemangeumensis]|uniref:hypothetical protein n=1 Tax=Nibrella saemangeumensis TaxID=1084526 RepID=UPI0031F011B0
METLTGRLVVMTLLLLYSKFGWAQPFLNGPSVQQTQSLVDNRMSQTESGSTVSHYYHTQALQQKLRLLSKRLIHLSVVRAPDYATLQEQLYRFLRQLESQPKDYRRTEIYQAVMMRLNQLDEDVKASLTDAHRMAFSQASLDTRSDTSFWLNRQVVTYPFAPVFRQADYRSALVHLLGSDESITILKADHDYYLVQWGTQQGYISKGMVVEIIPK